MKSFPFFFFFKYFFYLKKKRKKIIKKKKNKKKKKKKKEKEKKKDEKRIIDIKCKSNINTILWNHYSDIFGVILLWFLSCIESKVDVGGRVYVFVGLFLWRDLSGDGARGDSLGGHHAGGGACHWMLAADPPRVVHHLRVGFPRVVLFL